MTSHEIHMKRCLELAVQGLGNVAPNPMVGCVLVHSGTVIAEGYHQQYGSPHAEPNAIAKVDDARLQECTLFVNLEPCSHFGKTPPCADLIISKGIKKVVIGNLDPNPLVAGKGIEKLKQAGIEVEQGVLETECRELNKRFFTFHEKKRPYIILKWAQTADGYISRWPLPEIKEDNWITGSESRTLVHKWRAQEQAVLVGFNTVMNDNPYLTTRLVTGKNPLRMVLTRQADLPGSLHVLNGEAPTTIFNGTKDEQQDANRYVKIDLSKKIQQVMDYCYQNNIASVIVEGGTNTIYQFMNHNVWDEARVFLNPDKFFTNGIKAPEMDLTNHPSEKIGKDKLYRIKNISL